MFDNKEYESLKEIFSRYWSIYGGLPALYCSPYFHLSIILTFIFCPIWIQDKWWTLPLSIMPNILGFSLGGLAIFMALGDSGFKKIISGGANNRSPFMIFCSSFVHFIILQITSIITSIFSFSASLTLLNNTFLIYIIWACSFFIFTYALLTALAATMAIFRMASSYDKYHEK